MRSAKSKQSKQAIAEIEAKVKDGTWWPFTRVDPVILNRVHRQLKKQDQPYPEGKDALL